MAWLNASGGNVVEGRLTETVLWTNSSPTSEMAANTILTLNDDYTNYDFLKITYRLSTTNDTEWDVVMSKDSVDTAISETTNSNRIALCAYGSASVSVRLLSRQDSTTTNKLVASNSRTWGGTGTGTASMIPTKISGLKE